MFRILTLLIGMTAIHPVVNAEVLIGFDEAASEKQRALEVEFDQAISASEQDAWLRLFSAKPHHAGSKASKEVAHAIAELFISWGYDTRIEEYEILLPTPKLRTLELTAPTTYQASLTEDSLDEDPSTSIRANLLPPYNAFSVDGDVEAELVFINYGRPEDHELLERYGVDLKGKIAIAKYGKSWRGIKPKLAAEKGAIGTIIYSDPADDGYSRGDVYPLGPYKHESGVQRGSVMDMPTYPGDVLTPGVGATARAKRLKIKDASTITKIPVLPISYKDALPLLAAMGGSTVPAEWVGGLPITYHLGPGPARVRLKLEFNWNKTTIYNVIARLEGSELPDEWVIRGNHHDGWNHGANDPLSGMVALLAEAKSVAQLAQSGKPPARTVIYSAWDAEEPGLIGSTEWAEHHASDLKKHAVAYLNTDGNSRGFVRIGGSHTLERFFNQVMDDVSDPQTGVPVSERLRASVAVFGSDKQKKKMAAKKDISLYPLGSGSDYTPFLQHLGIASANLSFSGEGSSGSYHTLYDTYEHHTQWRDPGLDYSVALSKVAGRATLRLANAPVLPFEFSNLVAHVSDYIDELEELGNKMRKDTNKTNELLDKGTYGLALDSKKSLGPPARNETVPHFNFAPLKNAMSRLRNASDGLGRIDLANKNLSTGQQKVLNKILYTSERYLTRERGLPGRPWYKHHIYAPGLYTGYGVKTIPGVREAIEIREFDKVSEQIEIAAEVLDSLSARLEEAVLLLDK
ncbi:MAG TPA: M28 family peptidase [Gammaproteobacteria bacterium]|nr:M28 family peptidase [Gammaproteobacteria bacterium]HIL96482.1 M28 family peptidase [Pseudomonadales bacterium]